MVGFQRWHVQVKSQNDFTVNPRLLCSFTLASVSCGFFVIRLRPRSGRWRWHSSVWKCGCHQHNSSVFTYDSLMNFDWDHFDVAGVTHCRSTSNEVGIIFGGFQNSLPLNHTHARFDVRQNGENPIGDSLLLSGESQSQWAAALNTNLLNFNSRVDMKTSTSLCNPGALLRNLGFAMPWTFWITKFLAVGEFYGNGYCPMNCYYLDLFWSLPGSNRATNDSWRWKIML